MADSIKKTGKAISLLSVIRPPGCSGDIPGGYLKVLQKYWI
jgi:hypothetical protein